VYCDALIDERLCEHTSEHVNFLMMMFGLADPQQQQAIHRAIGRPDIRVGQVEPSFIWALEGLFRTGHDQWALDILRRRYQRLRRQGLTTIAELWNLLGERYTGRWRSRDTRSAVQGSGVTAAYLLSRFVLGVHPLRPGFAQVLICPALGDLKQASGVWPSPEGPIAVDWHRQGQDRFQIRIRLPEQVEGFFSPPQAVHQLKTWTVNGRPAATDPAGRMPIRGEVEIHGTA